MIYCYQIPNLKNLILEANTIVTKKPNHNMTYLRLTPVKSLKKRGEGKISIKKVERLIKDYKNTAKEVNKIIKDLDATTS